jgi:pSer/pThr/pTyr-binding forkhead associated (FHA) protein
MTAVLFLLRAAILVLLWGFVIAAIVAVRHDVFGTRRRTAPAPAQPAPAPKKQDKPARRRGAAAASKLAIVEGTLTGQAFPLQGVPITIGRAEDSTIVLTDDYVSNNHARLVPRGEDWVVEDLGSTNGTYVDRQRITAPVTVRPGMAIRVGKTVMELRR